MVKHATAADRPLAWRRLAVVAGTAAALVIPFAFTFSQFWSATGDDLTFTREERAGVDYMRPLTRLVAVLSDAQSAAVVGQQPSPGALSGALTSVATADRRHGEALGTTERWNNLSQRVSQLASRRVTGPEAYNSYSETLDLAMALMTKVGDESKLILDPELDSYYLIDATLIRIPSLLVDSGRMVDLARLAQNGSAPQQETAASRVFAARDRVGATATALDVGLKKSFDTTASSTLGPALLGHVDRVRSVVAELAPTTSLLDLPVAVGDAGGLVGARDRLRDASIQLDDTTLTELDALLVTRQDGINSQRTSVLAAIVLAALVGAVLLWARLPDRGEEEDDEEAAAPARHRAGVVPEPEEPSDLVDARQLLATGELVRVGRAVQSSRRERFDEPTE
jgi:hypothetical protein